MSLLFSCALRSCLCGLLVWALLKSLRIRDTGTETIIWTGVLAVALSMPLLNRYLPSLVVTIPYIVPPATFPVRLAAAPHATLPLLWVIRHGEACLLGTYAAGLVVYLTRLMIGLLRSLRLYFGAVPVEADWTGKRDVRACATLKSPASMAGVILLPADYHQWSDAKREAVIAHEAAHVARGDFFVQLAASVHCVFFWFSPFAWWLQSRLAEIAETASDEAAIERLDDRVTYAEILLEVACGTRQSATTVAMARGPFIQRRVEHILSGTRRRSPSALVRALIIGSLPVLALTVASADAARAPLPAIRVLERISPVRAGTHASSRSVSAEARPSAEALPSEAVPPPVETPRSPPAPGVTRAHRRAGRAALHVPKLRAVQASVPRGQTPISYNPKALLEVSSIITRPSLPSSIVHDGRTFYVLSTGKPVMEID